MSIKDPKQHEQVGLPSGSGVRHRAGSRLSRCESSGPGPGSQRTPQIPHRISARALSCEETGTATEGRSNGCASGLEERNAGS